MADSPKTLRVGVDELLYANITTAGAQATFALPPQTMNFRGQVVFFALQIGGTVTTATFQVEAAAQPQGATQSPFGIVAHQVFVSGAANTQSAYSGLALVTATVGTPVVVDLSGFGGSGLIRLNFSTFTLGTGTGMAVYARIG